MAPATTMTIDSTVAKIGRSMKKWDKVMQPGSSPACLWLGGGRFWRWQGLVLRDLLLLRIDLGACSHPLHPVHNHPILRLHPSRITRKPSMIGPSVTLRYSTVFWSLSTKA